MLTPSVDPESDDDLTELTDLFELQPSAEVWPSLDYFHPENDHSSTGLEMGPCSAQSFHHSYCLVDEFDVHDSHDSSSAEINVDGSCEKSATPLFLSLYEDTVHRFTHAFSKQFVRKLKNQIKVRKTVAIRKKLHGAGMSSASSVKRNETLASQPAPTSFNSTTATTLSIDDPPAAMARRPMFRPTKDQELILYQDIASGQQKETAAVRASQFGVHVSQISRWFRRHGKG